jgi:UDP-N-acetylmuramate--alanine ligase
MHIYFSGIGGAGLSPLALIAHQAGFKVSGSDSKQSQCTDYLQKNGISLHIGQSAEQIAAEHKKNPIDWIVFSSAVFITDPHNPEFLFAKTNDIKTSKRDACLNMILKEKGLKLIAIAGTHGKTTTTAMIVWLFKELGLPVSYSVGAKMSFGPMGTYDQKSEYFVYECDEFDRNFLSFSPFVSIITTVDWDHHEIYPTRSEYKQAFVDFIHQSGQTYLFAKDARYLDIDPSKSVTVMEDSDDLLESIGLAGLHNRQNARVAIEAISKVTGKNLNELVKIACQFPGSSRRFERLAPNIYTDYAHTPEEVRATMEMAQELSDKIVVVYEPLTDRRQHYMKSLYTNVFEPAKQVYWLPSYLAREDPNQTVLTPEDLISNLSELTKAQVAERDDALKNKILEHARSGDLVICMAGGGGGSLDEWARQELTNKAE